MEIKLEGRIIQKLEIETGTSARGEWKKQNFIIETVEQYPRKICIGIWTNQIPMLEQFQVGDMIWAYVNIESREFNGKWYTDVRAWKLEHPSQQQMAQPGMPQPGYAQMPQQPYGQQYPPQAGGYPPQYPQAAPQGYPQQPAPQYQNPAPQGFPQGPSQLPPIPPTAPGLEQPSDDGLPF